MPAPARLAVAILVSADEAPYDGAGRGAGGSGLLRFPVSRPMDDAGDPNCITFDPVHDAVKADENLSA